MVERFVYGEYVAFEAAQSAVDQLIQHDVPKTAISIAAKRDVLDRIDTSVEVVDETDVKNEVDNRSWWEKIFTSDQDDEIVHYKNIIAGGEILVIVDEAYHEQASQIDPVENTAVAPVASQMDKSEEQVGFDSKTQGKTPPSQSDDPQVVPTADLNQANSPEPNDQDDNIDIANNDSLINDDMVYGRDYTESDSSKTIYSGESIQDSGTEVVEDDEALINDDMVYGRDFKETDSSKTLDSDVSPEDSETEVVEDDEALINDDMVYGRDFKETDSSKTLD